ncbi:VIT domain-containing protein [Schlesneria sp. T3-172]|uniref:VIT domain-containing protein n=1 Tax=Schlesneria sphaerica TaxID=3373610 RepID=UPI0037C57914
MKRYLFLALGIITGLMHSVAAAQGVLIITSSPVPLPRPHHPPHPPSTPVVSSASYKIKELAIHSRITDQVARTQVSQTFVNMGSNPIEVKFLFPLPHDSAIDKLTLLVDGKEMPGKLLPANEAKSVYESIVRSNKDPALLEWMGMGLFQTSVFPVPAGAERKVAIHYHQLLEKDRGLTDFLFPLSTAKYTSHAVEKVDIQVAIESTIDIKNIYSPTHAIEIKRPGARNAVISYSRTNDVPTTDFRLMYDVDKGDVGARVISYRPSASDEGYFLMLASPQVKPIDEARPPKTVLFVVDRSGSMSGKKFEQARAAIKFVLNNLRSEDLFNIIAYDGNIESFRPELERYTDETRRAAIGFVEGLYPGGGTNIAGSLKTALEQLKDDSRPSYILFLTDGLPTVGTTNEGQIAEAARQANRVRARILTFGVGYDVNSRLLDRISRDGFGLSEYVRPDEEIETHVSTVYSNISSPVLTDVKVSFELDTLKAEDGPPVNRLYPKTNFDLFEGQQLVIAGRYKKPGAAKVVVSGRVGKQEQRFDFPADLIEKSNDESYAFVEKIWAMRRIGEIIDQLDLVGKNDELVKELVELSTRHGILTPYTSFLADETVRPSLASADAVNRTRNNLTKLNEASGMGGVSQRFAKGLYQKASNAEVATHPSGAGGIPGPVARPSALGASAGGTTGYSLNSYVDIESDSIVATDSVRQIGNRSVYARKRPGQLDQILVTPETAEVDMEKDREKIETIERFSEAYFKLVEANTPTENQILSQQAQGQQLLIQLRGKIYLVK